MDVIVSYFASQDKAKPPKQAVIFSEKSANGDKSVDKLGNGCKIAEDKPINFLICQKIFFAKQDPFSTAYIWIYPHKIGGI